MAKRSIASNITITPSQGSGDTNISVKATKVHTGRVARTQESIAQVVGGTNIVKLTTIEVAKPLFVEFDTESPTIGKEGGVLKITGKSNAAKLNFTISVGATIPITTPTSYKANSVVTNNNVAIAGDPGASNEYPFEVEFNIPANTTVNALSASLIVTPDDTPASAKTASIAQTAGEAYLYINENGTTEYTINLDQNGSAKTVSIISNTNWTF